MLRQDTIHRVASSFALPVDHAEVITSSQFRQSRFEQLKVRADAKTLDAPDNTSGLEILSGELHRDDLRIRVLSFQGGGGSDVDARDTPQKSCFERRRRYQYLGGLADPFQRCLYQGGGAARNWKSHAAMKGVFQRHKQQLLRGSRAGNLISCSRRRDQCPPRRDEYALWSVYGEKPCCTAVLDEQKAGTQGKRSHPQYQSL